MPARGERAVVGHDALAQQRLDDRRRERVGDPLQHVPARRAPPRPARIATRSPASRTSAARRVACSSGSAAAACVDRAHVPRPVALRPWALVGGLLLEIGREAQVRHASPGHRRAARERCDVLEVGAAHDPGVVDGDVLEHARQVDILLGRRVDQVAEVVAGDREHGRAVELRVVQPVGQVQAARARGRQAHAQPAAELRVRGCGERGRFLVANLDEADLLLVRAQGLHDPVDAVAGQAEHDVHAPLDQGLDQHVSCGLGHGNLPLDWGGGCRRRGRARTARRRSGRGRWPGRGGGGAPPGCR